MGAGNLIKVSQWVMRDPLMAGKTGDVGASGKGNRLYLDGGQWIMRTGSPWRDFPAEPGNWHTTCTGFKRRGESGRWQMILVAVSGDKDLEILMIECTVVRAHHHVAGAQEKPGTRKSGDPVAG